MSSNIKVITCNVLRKIVLIVFILFSWCSRKQSRSCFFYRILTKIFSIWMCLRFNCTNCYFSYPMNYRCGTQHFLIGKNCSFGKFAVLTAWEEYRNNKYKPNITIGEKCYFGDYLHLTCINEITIGNNVLTGRWVTISDNAHGEINIEAIKEAPSERPLTSKGSVRIGNNVWIGDKVTILAGVIIGDNTIIGANSVVTKSIPSNCVAAGNPAKVIKRLD